MVDVQRRRGLQPESFAFSLPSGESSKEILEVCTSEQTVGRRKPGVVRYRTTIGDSNRLSDNEQVLVSISISLSAFSSWIIDGDEKSLVRKRTLTVYWHESGQERP